MNKEDNHDSGKEGEEVGTTIHHTIYKIFFKPSLRRCTQFGSAIMFVVWSSFGVLIRSLVGCAGSVTLLATWRVW